MYLCGTRRLQSSSVRASSMPSILSSATCSRSSAASRSSERSSCAPRSTWTAMSTSGTSGGGAPAPRAAAPPKQQGSGGGGKADKVGLVGVEKVPNHVPHLPVAGARRRHPHLGVRRQLEHPRRLPADRLQQVVLALEGHEVPRSTHCAPPAAS